MRMADLIKAAKTYDMENRPFGGIWTSVPDSQVERLLVGAKIAILRAEAAAADAGD